MVEPLDPADPRPTPPTSRCQTFHGPSGHICAVVPERPPDHQALRDGRTVRTPLQSQAGPTNLKFFTRVWWTVPQFRDFGFWVHR